VNVGVKARPRRIAIVVLAAGSVAYAEPNLRLDHEPPPRDLHMRPPAHRAVAAMTPPSITPPAAAAPPQAPPPAPSDVAFIRDVREPVSVRFSLGYQVDGTTLSGDRALSNNLPNRPGMPDFDLVHAYGFGEGYLSTHGLGLPSLSSYIGAHFELSQHDSAGNAPTPPPIATWFDRSTIVYQNVWAELKDFLSPAYAPLRIRAGEQYVYGPWVTHMYGALAAWDGKFVSGEIYGGSRVPDYTLQADQNLDRAAIAGGSAHVDLRGLPTPIPIALTAQGLAFTHVGASGNTPASFSLLEADWRPNGDVTVIGQWRTIDGAAAEEHVQLRVRYHAVTNVVVDVTHREQTDWRWDPSLVAPEANDPLAAKRYLDLGPVQPQLLMSARAGTLIAENVDLYARAAWSQDLVSDAEDVNTFYATYYEGGGALEVRVRRTLAIGLSGLARYTDRADQMDNRIEDMTVPMVAEPLPISAAMGERDFIEAGATARMTLGARKFSALVEIYGRNTDYARDYCIGTNCQSDSDTGIPTSELRGGGRFTVDAWIGKRVRLFASYDLSSRLPFAPEITGYKSLKLVMEGVY